MAFFQASALVAILLVGLSAAAPLEVNTMHGGARSQFSKEDTGTYGTTVTKQRPISRVTALMKDMKVEIEKEGEEDAVAYEKFSCWCETNDKTKTKSIADGNQKVAKLEALISELGATSKQLTTDIAGLEKTIAKGEAALDEASAVRAKELAEFNQEDKDAIVAVKGLHSAVTTLSKHNGAALNQETMMQVQEVLKRHVPAAQLRRFGLGAEGRRSQRLLALIQQPVAAKSYSEGGGEIFGVLSSMKESFETNMNSARAEEKQAAAEFATLKAAKTSELAAANDQLDSKSAELAKTDEDHANSKTDLKNTQAELEADETFLADLKAKCAQIDKDWEERTKMRNEEIEAVSQAIEILSHDDARDVASKTTGFFLQVASRSAGQGKATKMLMKLATRFHHPKLGLMAINMKNDAMEKMIEQIKALIEDLNKEKHEEVLKKDRCIEELHQSDLVLDEKYHEKSNLETKQADLNSELKRLEDEMAAARASIADSQIQMKKAGEVRVKESTEFTTAIADQREMQAIVRKAVAKLRAFYDKASFVQGGEAQPQEGVRMEGFQPYRKEHRGGMAIATLEHLAKDSYNVQNQAYAMNGQSQRAYEEFMKELNKSIITLRLQIADQTKEHAEATAALARVKADLEQNMEDLEAQDTLANEIHKDCDFLVQNFELRQKAMTDEVDGLYEAISMMTQGQEKPPKEEPTEAPAEEAAAPAL